MSKALRGKDSSFKFLTLDLCCISESDMVVLAITLVYRQMRGIAQALVFALLTIACAPLSVSEIKVNKVMPELLADEYVSYDGDHFPYHRWLGDGKVDTIVIGMHGIDGTAQDFANLGEYLQKHRTGVALYAADVRGLGMDPLVERRGDIHSEKEWFRDLATFSQLVAAKYPAAKVVWYGESMGGLIVAHGYDFAKANSWPLPDAVVVAAPVVSLDDKLAGWHYGLLKVGALAMPNIKVSLQTLAGGEPLEVFEGVDHHDQVAQNPWHVERYSLRLLVTLAEMVRGMPQALSEAAAPTLLLQGGKDIFSTREQLRQLVEQANRPSLQWKYYPDSFHLLLYDPAREEIFADLVTFLASLGSP